MARSLIVNSRITIPATELIVTFARSSGPGGQNVNKVNSKATLRWNVASTQVLSPPVISRFLRKFPNRITQDGDLLISSDRYRDQARNVTDCHEKLRQLIQSALLVPQSRKSTQPTRGSVERRLQGKREKSKRKQLRKFRSQDDD